MITRGQLTTLIVGIILSVWVGVFPEAFDTQRQLNIFMATTLRIVIFGTILWTISQVVIDWWKSKKGVV